MRPARISPTLTVMLLAGVAAAHDAPSAETLTADLRGADRMALEADARACAPTTLAAMMREGPRDARLAAVRGARGADDPWAVLEPLAVLMAGDDPELAPAAALALLDVTAELRPDSTMEHLPSELSAALAPALSLADDASRRPDLRDAARALRGALQAFPGAVPAPASAPSTRPAQRR